MRNVMLCVVFVTLLVGSASADLGPVIGGMQDSSSAVTASWSLTEWGSAANIVNGAGFDATAGTHQWGNAGTTGGYVHGSTGPSPSGSNPAAWMAFEFDKVYELGGLQSWGYGTDGVWSSLTLKTANLEYFDGTAWQTFGIVEFGRPDSALFYDGQTPFSHDTEIDLQGIHASKIVLNVLDCHNPSYPGYAGLYEVRFFETPEPATVALLSLGGLALIRRRQV